ncbi:iron-sulfur cluster assembly scaffold protein [Novosphingobium sp. ERN07]|uniref:iron-sulfur cluster assembly scaffold protein n=1 Tax=Novosphingobium sp. ERN07 TaxID=2726187 RepID=UPI0014564D54|nr:iron-sulfur cluster assembly scaffold protein [Novosphingobium sp. ERN07]NLR70019.1 iron-sulfur cluster assembly scaffold protein [Novosphingobium sp. ERN07]
MSAGRGLYTPEVLALAMELSAAPWDEALPHKGNARSRCCGSTIDIALATDAAGAITAIGLRPHACAVGQAAAALFVRSAKGRDQVSIAASRAALADWLAGEGPQPDWPELDLLTTARTYPARHGAILLAWDAALDALPTPDQC